LTAERLYTDYVKDRRITPSQIVYHVRQLERDGIVTVDASATAPQNGAPSSSLVLIVARRSAAWI
jgi:hypothetical protein